jgi:hypothetical protein
VSPVAIRAAGEDSWPRVVYGRLIHDILVVNRGLALARTELYSIVGVRPIEVTTAPKKMGDAMGWSLSIDGHDDIEVAVPPVAGRRLDGLAQVSPGSPRTTPAS